MIGTTLGHFRIVARLGGSASGEVYRAEDEALRRHVALEVLNPAHAADPDSKSRFLNAARAASLVTHPHVAAVHEVGESEGRVWVAMELVEGATLRSRLAGRPLPLVETLRIGEQVAEGLAAAHERGLAHGDLRPEKVVLLPGGQAKVVDLGLAGEDGGAAHAGPYDTRTDVYRLGAMLYEMATGQVPHAAEGAGTSEASAAGGEAAASTLPSRLNVEIPPELDRIIGACLEADPEDRYQHTGQLAIDLGRLRRRTETDSIVARSGETAVRPRPRALRRWAWSAAAVALATALGLAGWKWAWPRLVPGSPFQAGDRILIADFENETTDAELGLALRDLFETSIGGYVRLQPIPRMLTEDVSAVYGPAAAARCLKGECAGYVTGALSGDAGEYTLKIALYRAGGAKPVYERLAQAGEDRFGHAFGAMLDGIERDMQKRWGLGVVHNPYCNATWSGNANALKAYQAHEKANRLRFTKGPEAIALLKRAVELDPAAAGTLFMLGIVSQDPRAVNLARLKEAWRLAAAAAEEHPECREEALVYEVHYLERSWGYDAELERLSRGIQMFPSNNEFQLMYAITSARTVDDPEVAVPIYKKTFGADPDLTGPFEQLAFWLIAAGRFDEVEALIDSLKRRAPSDDIDLGGRIANIELALASARGKDGMELVAMIDGFIAAGRVRSGWGRRVRGTYLAEAGRLGEAEQMLRQAQQRAEASAARAGAVAGRGYDTLDWLENRRTGKVRRLNAGEIDGYLDTSFDVARLAEVSIELRTRTALATVLRSAEEEHKEIVNQRVLDVFQYSRGCLALLGGQFAEAVALLEPLAREYGPRSLVLQPHGALAEAQEGTGHWAEAARAWEVVLGIGRDPTTRGPELVLDEHRLAGIYERLGNTERARYWYGRFLNDWRNADPGMPEVEDAKRRLAVLGGPLPAGSS
jgi:tetratricopeptide (TPR) repeat protein